MLQSAFAIYPIIMSLRFRSFYLIGVLLIALSLTGMAQTETPNTPAKTPKPSPTPKAAAKIATAEQAVESAIFLYGFPGGRTTLNQIRKTTLERGTSRVMGAEGKLEQTNYQRYVIRGDSVDKEKIRLDQEFPSAKYSMVFTDGKIFGVYNNTVFTPREDASKTFENQIVHGLEALLRY